jgi:hypothetical protein
MKGISFKRKTTISMALLRYDQDGEVYTALALGLDAGQHADAASDNE